MSEDKVNAKPMKRLLEKVHLNGLIEECLLKIEGGVGTVVAIDLTNSVFLQAREEGLEGLADGSYGITNITLLIKYLKTIGDEDVNYTVSDDGKWLTLKRKSKGKISVLLIEDEDLVCTKMTEEPDMEEIISKYGCSIRFKASFVTEAAYYMGLINEQSVTFQIKDKKAILHTDQKANQYFELPVKGVVESDDDFSVTIYGKHLMSLFEVIKVKKETKIYILPEYPIVFKQDDENYWAITPIMN